jgi:hypothetical protein
MNAVWNHAIWNHTAWNGLLFDRAWICASAGAAAAAVIVALLALGVCRAVRGRPAPCDTDCCSRAWSCSGSCRRWPRQAALPAGRR